jgi:GNAT superfamily N-acetyltransferase
MLAHPELVAGEELRDTKIMHASRARALAKTGAEGVQALALPRSFQVDPGAEAAIGCLIKIEDGSGRPLTALSGAFLSAWGLSEAADELAAEDPAVGRTDDGRETSKTVVLVGERDLRRRPSRDGVVDGGERSEAEPADLESRGVSVDVGRGNERDVLRFFREEWPLADEETFGRRMDWRAEPLALIVRRRKRVLAVLRGHFVGGVGSLDEFVVGKGHRGRGLGSALLRRFETEALRRGCDRVVLRAVKDAESERFYRDRGYSRESVQLSYEFGWDYVRLTRRIAEDRD